jgi:hypothetical protein
VTARSKFYAFDDHHIGMLGEPMCETCSERACARFPGRPQRRLRASEYVELTCHSCGETYEIDREARA